MKTKLLSVLALALLSLTFKAQSQCAATQSVGLLVSTTTTVNSTSPFVIKVCGTGFVYDTLCCSSKMYYMEPGSQVRLKGNNTTIFYMQSGSTLTIIGNGSTGIYRELGATVIGGMNSTTCTAVTFPATPACNSTGLNESHIYNTIGIYPNPANDLITINHPYNTALQATIYNSLGQKVKSVSIESENTTVNISDLNKGIYYMSFTDNGKTVLTKKITVLK